MATDERRHLIECNYHPNPIGSPGCICILVNRNEYADLTAQLEAEKARVAELRKALRHYADEENWQPRHGKKALYATGSGQGTDGSYNLYHDGYEVAQAALKEKTDD